jgi:hypothetical protein
VVEVVVLAHLSFHDLVQQKKVEEQLQLMGEEVLAAY